MNILLLNPPCNRIVNRSNYCSNESKASYYFPPADLIMISGILDQYHKLTVLDAIANRMSPKITVDIIQKGNYDAIIFLTGAISAKEDMIFMEKVKQSSPRTLLIIKQKF